MEYIDNKPVLDFTDCINYIAQDTGYNSEIVAAVINSETEYMRKFGIITDIED